MFARLLLLFTVVPAVELVLLILLGRWIGLLPTVLLIILTGVVGAALARREGLRAWLDVRRALAEGRTPGEVILNGLAIFLGGSLLLTPGVLTDAVGFLLLLPPTRRAMVRRVRARVERRIRRGRGEIEVRFWQGGGPS